MITLNSIQAASNNTYYTATINSDNQLLLIETLNGVDDAEMISVNILPLSLPIQFNTGHEDTVIDYYYDAASVVLVNN